MPAVRGEGCWKCSFWKSQTGFQYTGGISAQTDVVLYRASSHSISAKNRKRQKPRFVGKVREKKKRCVPTTVRSQRRASVRPKFFALVRSGCVRALSFTRAGSTATMDGASRTPTAAEVA